MIYTIFLILFSALLLHYLLFLLKINKGLSKVFKTEEPGSSTGSFISVVIPFRNEADNIKESLDRMINQNRTDDNYEVIYVNDNSDDGGDELLRTENRSSAVRALDLEYSSQHTANKKHAVRFGISKAKGDIIAGSDADCIQGDDWLNAMEKCMDEKTGFVSGPVTFEDDGTLFGRLQQIEFAGLVLAGAGLIGAGNPTICNGANIAYRKKVFDEVGGFSDNINLSSGDDEFLMQKIHRQTDYRVRFCSDPDALVTTAPNRTIGQFFQQRRRWASKGFFYHSKVLIARLALIFMFFLTIPASLILGFVEPGVFLPFVGCAFLLKALMEMAVMRKGIPLLLNKLPVFTFFIAEFLHFPYIIFTAVAGSIGNFNWKERDLKR